MNHEASGAKWAAIHATGLTRNNSQPYLIPMRMRARAAATSQKHSQGCTAMLARCTIECMHASTPSAPAGTCLQPPHQPTTHIVVEPAGHVEGPQLQRRKLALQVGHVTANGRALHTARKICTCTCSRCAPLSAVCVIIRVRKYLHVVVCRRKNAQRVCSQCQQPVLDVVALHLTQSKCWGCSCSAQCPLHNLNVPAPHLATIGAR